MSVKISRRAYKNYCMHCVHKDVALGDEPCLSCKPSKWQKIEG